MSEFNQWFLSLSEERQRALREDKWALANAAFESGKQQANTELLEALTDIRKWVADGEFSDDRGIYNDCATTDYKRVVSKVDAVIGKASGQSK